MSTQILVVDDEPDLEALVTQKFRRQIRAGELVFLFAHDGHEALSILAEHRDVDLVLSDINMPRMDGLTLLSNLKRLDHELRTVVVSAYGDMRNIRTAMNRGAFDFVTKPIDFDDLETTMNRALEELRDFKKLQRMHEDAEKSKAALSRYFSPNVVKLLAEDPNFLNLGGERRELTFLFTDLADFTPLVERLDPTVVVELLNEYLDLITHIVFRHGGTLDKIVGDAAHALFGAPVEQSDHAERAIACSMELDKTLEAFKKEKVSQGIPLGSTRIGVHSGPAIVGNFGGELFFDYTAHGDAINTTARLEHVNKRLGTRICVSGATVRHLSEFSGRPVGTLFLKGKSEGLEVFEPIDADEADSPSVTAYKAAFEKLRAHDPGAGQAFAALVGEFGETPLARFHLKRLLEGEKGELIYI